ncbi:MAG: FecR domain-containing protein [Caulobacter sp.]|nr:FecR domain-containing protein [Caulobacter sp.]
MTRGTPTLEELRGLTSDQAAARWLASEDRDPSALVHWLAQNGDNRDAWAKARRSWDVFDDAEDNDLIAAMARAARQAKPEPVAGWFRPGLIAASIAAAALAMTFVVGAQQGWLDRTTKPAGGATNAAASLAAIGRPDYVTGRGQRSIIDLSDGTRVTLDADTAVDVAFADGRRDVRLLNGRAFFDVAHDRAHPFAVQAGGRTVTALGTQFDVRLTPGALQVVLAEGRVRVTLAAGGPAAPPVELAPGQAFSAQTGAAGKVAAIDLDEALAWKQGVVEFHDQPLSEAVGLLNRYTRAQIVIKDPKVAALRVTGVFKTGDVERFGRAVSQVLPVRMVARDADTYELVSAKR